MKKSIVFFSVLVCAFGAYAEAPSGGIAVATTQYVQSAADKLDNDKQDKLSTDSIVETGSGPMVSSVTANNGTVTVERSQVAIPVGDSQSTTYAQIWIQ